MNVQSGSNNPASVLQVVIVTTVGCQYCKRAKDILRAQKVEYDEIEASNQLELLDKIRATTGKRTVPQVGPAALILLSKNYQPIVWHIM